jgi:protein tyrosine phosphatase (PTP) superfamily phosphohydrolase (DUF442 family)
MSMVEMIHERLYVGGKISNNDWRFIQKNITAIINLRTKPDTPPLDFGNRVMIWVPLSIWEAPNLQWVINVMRRINVLFDSGHRILIHCKLGMHRSGFVVTAFYMQRFGMSRDEALKFARQRKPDLDPPPNYMLLLSQYEDYLRSPRRSHPCRNIMKYDY